MKSTSAIFAEGAIGLLRRALADGLSLDITVNATEARAVLTDARGAELARETRGGQLALPLAPVEAAPPCECPAPVEATSHHGVSVGDRLILDGVAVEVVGVDSGGFAWHTVDQSDDPWEGFAFWSEVRHVAANVWAPRTIARPDVAEEPAVEAAPPAKKTRAKKARAPKAVPSTEPAAPVPHRLQAVTEADELAHHGAHSLIGLICREWRTLATRESGETAPTWQARCTLASKTVRVRVYDRATRCTWDSLDGNAEGYIHGGPA